MAEKITVHAMHHGRILCGFGAGIPAVEWPENHKWMALVAYGCGPAFSPDVVRSMGSEPCTNCVDLAEQMGDEDEEPCVWCEQVHEGGPENCKE